jgi:hypothetical protein
MNVCDLPRHSEKIFRMTSEQRYIVHLVARRHVDFGMTRSMMCMSA